MGFKTSGGIDDNRIEFSVSNMFTPSQKFAYCSAVSPNVNVTGIVINEDVDDIE